MRTLTVRTSGDYHATFTESAGNVWKYEYQGHKIKSTPLLFFLEKENNRGFTFRNYSLFPNYFEVFISNGDIISDFTELYPNKKKE